MYLMTSTRCGISAKQIERELGVTYKTAWRMAYLIRNKLMTQDVGPLAGGGAVEMDETYIGGYRRGTPPGRPTMDSSHKTPVFGMVQRKGRVWAAPVRSVKGRPCCRTSSNVCCQERSSTPMSWRPTMPSTTRHGNTRITVSSTLDVST